MPKVLIIDDQPIVARVIHHSVAASVPEGWTVEHRTDPLEGLARAGQDPDVSIVIVDLSMPLLRGEELIAVVISERPQLRGSIVVCTGGYIERDHRKVLFDELGCRELRKPVTLDALADLFSILIPEDQ